MNSDYYYVLNWVEDGGKRYFVPINLNLYIEYDTKSGVTNLASEIKESYTQGNLYSEVIRYKDFLLFIPLHAQHFMRIDLKTKNKEYFDIPKTSNIHTENAYFSSAYLDGHILYVVGYRYCGILKINLESMSIEILDSWCRGQKITQTDTSNILKYGTAYADGIIYAISADGTMVLQYDTKNNVNKWIKFNNLDCHWDAIAIEESYIWLVSNDKRYIRKYDWEEEQFVCSIEIEQFTNNPFYGYCFFVENRLILLPLDNLPVLIWESKTNKCYEIWLDKENRKGFFPLACKLADKKIIICDKNQKSTYEIDIENYKAEKVLWKRDYKKIRNIYTNMSELFVSESVIELEEFISYIKDKK